MTTSAEKHNVIVLGGSYGGLSTAHYLVQHVVPSLPDCDIYQVIIVSPSAKVMCRPACPRALIADEFFRQDKLFVDIDEQFEQYPKGSFRFIKGVATKFNHQARNANIRLASDGSELVLDFHALVVATGTSTPSPLLGMNVDEVQLRAAWQAVRLILPTAKRIVIAGGGPAGIETAGELGEYLNRRPGWLKSTSSSPKVEIIVVTSGAQILPALRPSLAKKAEDYLPKVGVTIIKNTKVTTVLPETAGTKEVASRVKVTLGNGQTLEADLYIPAYGTTPNTGFIDKSLLAPDGRIDVNVSTLRVDKAGPRVYAIGDVSSAARPAIHLTLDAIPVLCTNIKRDLLLAAGKSESEVGSDRIFKEDTRETQLVPLGKGFGVGAAMGWQVPSFFVWAIKGRDYWLWTTGNLWSGKQWAKAS